MKALDYDLETEVGVSYKNFQRSRNKFREKAYKEIVSNFIAPDNSNLHFDGKSLTDNTGQSGEWLAIVLSGNNDECKQGKLLSAEHIRDGTGSAQAEEIIRSLNLWGCAHKIVGLVFDTCRKVTVHCFKKRELSSVQFTEKRTAVHFSGHLKTIFRGVCQILVLYTDKRCFHRAFFVNY